MEPRTDTDRKLSPPTEWIVAPEKEKSRTDQMVDWGIEETERKYGENSEQPKAYHNEEHIRRVVEAVKRIGVEEGLTQEEVDLLKVAAAWHDVETGMGPGTSEDESARFCQNEMKMREWGKPEIEVVGELIRATKNTIIERVIKQEVGDPDEVLGKYKLGLMRRVMADADLSNCGEVWESYRQQSLALGREVHLVKSDKEMSDIDWQSFWGSQYSFLDGLLSNRGGFYTDGAKRAYPNMANNLELVRQLKWRAPMGKLVVES